MCYGNVKDEPSRLEGPQRGLRYGYLEVSVGEMVQVVAPKQVKDYIERVAEANVLHGLVRG